MRAVVCDTYGAPDVLRLEQVARPVPEADEVLVKVLATTVTRSDCATRSANRQSGVALSLVSRLVTGLRRPRRRILGIEFAGRVEAVGESISDFAPGDEVFGTTGFRFGAHAEFVCIPETGRIARKPTGTSFEEAAAVCDGGLTALSCLRRSGLHSGQSILIYGGSGSIGTAAVQLAKLLGADVTAVTSTKNIELVRSLGADRVIDYTRDDFTRNAETYDVIFDAVGKLSFRRSRRSLKRDGIYIPTDGVENLLLVLATSRIGHKRVIFPVQRMTNKDVVFLKELIEAGKYRPVIDRRYALEDVVEATRYVETRHKTGNVVLTVGSGRD